MLRIYRRYDHPIPMLIDLLLMLVVNMVCFLIKVAFWLAVKIAYGAFWLLGFLFGFLRSPYTKRQYSALGRQLGVLANRGAAAVSHRWHDYQTSRKRKKQRWFADADCTIECDEPTF